MSDITTLMMAAAGAGGAEETDPNFNQTVLLLHGDGTNGAQNNTFLDSSTNNFTITRNGNTTQGTFSPFSAPDGGWSNFITTGDVYLSTSNTWTQLGSGDFSVEAFVYFTALTTSFSIVDARSTDATAENWIFAVNTSNKLRFVIDNSNALTSTSNVPINEWVHVAICRVSGVIYAYINGVQDASTLSYASAINGVGTTPRIGDLIDTSTTASGYISNLRAVVGSSAYSATFTVPTVPLTAIANTQLLTCQSNRFVDNSTNNFAITRNGGVKVTPFSPFAPTSAYDASVNGGSGYFDGTSDYLQVSDATLALGTGDFSIQFWVYNIAFDGSSGINTLIDYRNGSDPVISPVIFTTNGQLFFRTNGSNVISGSTLNLNEWYFIGISRASGTTKMFVNGVQVGSDYSDTNNYTSSVIRIGADYDATLNQELNGYMSGLKITQGAAVDFSALGVPTTPPTADANTELLLNFTNAGIFDNTGKNNLETVGNAQIDTTTKKYGTGSMEFDGTGDYLRIVSGSPDIALGSGDWTIEFWLYFDTVQYAVFIDQRPPSTPTNGVYPTLAYDPANGYLFFFTDSNYRIQSNAALSGSTWYHIACCKASGSTRLFVDGTQVGSTYSDTNNYLSGGIVIGSRADLSTAQLDGFIDDLRITKGVARYTTTFTPPTKAFPDL